MPTKKRPSNSVSTKSIFGLISVSFILLLVFCFNLIQISNSSFLNKGSGNKEELDVFIVAPEEINGSAYFYLESSTPNPEVGVPFTISLKLKTDNLDNVMDYAIQGFNLALFVPKPLTVVENSFETIITGGVSDFNVIEDASTSEVSYIYAASPDDDLYVPLYDLALDSPTILNFDVVTNTEITGKNINFKISNRSPKMLMYDINSEGSVDLIDTSKLQSLKIKVAAPDISGLEFSLPKNGDVFPAPAPVRFVLKFTDPNKPQPERIEVSAVRLGSNDTVSKDYNFDNPWNNRFELTEMGDYILRASAYAEPGDTSPIKVVSTRIKLRSADLNGDGDGDFKDLLIVIDWITSDNPYKGAYDINGDGNVSPNEDPDFNNDDEVDLLDLVELVNWIYRPYPIDDPLPPPP